MSRIAVLCSGGVDSSVALMRLAQEGVHDLTAFYLKIWLEDEMAFLGSCPWEEDLEYVRQVCERAAVPLEIVDAVGVRFRFHQPVSHVVFLRIVRVEKGAQFSMLVKRQNGGSSC